LAVFSTTAAGAAEQPGRVVIARGAVTVTGADEVKSDLSPGDVVNEGDTVEVGAGSFTRLMMGDGSVLDLSAGTRVVFRTYSIDRDRAQRRASMKVWIGRIWARVARAFGSDDNYTIDSDNAVAGVRGTEFVFEVEADGRTHLSVIEGEVAFSSKVTQISELLGAMTRGAVDAAGQLTRGDLSASDLAALREGARPQPTLDAGASDDRLRTVRERLGVEVTPSDEPVPVPAEKEQEEDPFDALEEDPSDPLLDLDPGAGRTRVRGTVEVIQP
jgi:hypothetical protein